MINAKYSEYWRVSTFCNGCGFNARSSVSSYECPLHFSTLPIEPILLERQCIFSSDVVLETLLFKRFVLQHFVSTELREGLVFYIKKACRHLSVIEGLLDLENWSDPEDAT